MSTISIVGCGWLGLPLGRELADAGHRVKGSTTSPDRLPLLKDAGIEPHLLTLSPDPEGDIGTVLEAEILFVNVPPPRDVDNRHAFHQRQMRVLDAATTADWALVATSTGVYPDADRTVVEDDVPVGEPPTYEGPRRDTGVLLGAVESLWAEGDRDVTILRFGGLYGPNRHPGRFLAGRSDLERPHAPVNLIHLDDCIGLVQAILSGRVTNDVFNMVAPEHPTRRSTYIRAARSLGLEPPSFDLDDTRGGKRVSGQKAVEILGYSFHHPDPSDVGE